MKTFASVAELTAQTLKAGEKVRLDRYYVNGPLVAGLVYEIQGSGTADGSVNHTLANGNIAVLSVSDQINIRQAGAKTQAEDNTFDNYTLLQRVLDDYKSIYVPSGVFQSGTRLIARESSVITFGGWIKYKDGSDGSAVAVLSCSEPHITLINPQLDGNRDNTGDLGNSGIYSVLSNYGTGFHLTVLGGTLKNARHNCFQGGRDGLTMIGTEMNRAGEHVIYVNGVENSEPTGELADNLLFENCKFIEPRIEATHPECHYIQLRNAGKVTLRDCIAEGADINPSIPTFGILSDSVADLVVENCKFRDLNHRGIWHSTSTAFPAGELKVENCEFDLIDSPVTRSFMLVNAPNVKVKVADCKMNGYFLGQSPSSNTQHIEFTNCTWSDIRTEFSTYMQTSFLNCDFDLNATAPTRLFRVFDETLRIVNSELTGNIAEGVFVEGGRVEIDNFRLPDKTGSDAILLSSATTAGPHLIKNAYFPLADSTSSIRITAMTTADTVIGGLYMPLGGINNTGSGALIEYGNVRV